MINLATKKRVWKCVSKSSIASYLAKTSEDADIQRMASSFRDEIIRAELATNPNLHAEVLEKLLADKSDHVLKALTCNPLLTPEQVEFLFFKNKTAIIQELVTRDDLTEELIQTMLSKPRSEGATAILSSPSLSLEMLEEFIKTKKTDRQRIFLACNPLLTKSMRDVLMRSKCYDALHSLAQHEALTEEELIFLAGEEGAPSVVADRKKPLPESVKEVLLGHDSDYIRSCLSFRKDLSKDQYHILATEGDVETKSNLLLFGCIEGRHQCDKFSEKTLRLLAEDEDPKVSKQAGILLDTKLGIIVSPQEQLKTLMEDYRKRHGKKLEMDGSLRTELNSQILSIIESWSWGIEKVLWNSGISADWLKEIVGNRDDGLLKENVTKLADFMEKRSEFTAKTLKKLRSQYGVGTLLPDLDETHLVYARYDKANEVLDMGFYRKNGLTVDLKYTLIKNKTHVELR